MREVLALVAFFDAARVAAAGFSVAESVDQIRNGEGNKALEAASIVTKTATIGLSIVDVILNAINSGPTTFRDFKIVELCVRGVDIPIQISRVATEKNDSTKLSKTLRVLAPIAAFVNTMVQELDFIKNIHDSKEELEKENVAVAHLDANGHIVFDSSKRFILDEFSGKVEFWNNLYGQMEICTGAVEAGCNIALANVFFDRILERIRNRQEASIPLQDVEPVTNPEEIVVNPENYFDLLALPFIPDQLEDDAVLSQYKCNILHRPARYPVQDPTVEGSAIVVYERQAILSWLNASQRPISPTTGKPLHIEDLREAVDENNLSIQEIINDRLNFLQNSLLEISQTKK